MSMAAMTLARKCKTESPPAKAVLMALADYAGDQWQCWPSQQMLMEYTELGERTVRKALDLLEEQGLIVRKERRTAQGTRRSDLITLTLEQPARGAGSGERPASGAAINRHVVPQQPASGAGISDERTPIRTLSRKGAGARDEIPDPPTEPAKPLSDERLRAKLVAQLPDGCTWPVRNSLALQPIRQAMDEGADLERHVLPAIRFEAEQARQGGRRISTWAAFTTAILARMERERSPVPAAQESQVFPDDWWRGEVAYWRKTGGQWSHDDVSEPPDSPRTAVPKHILAEFGYGQPAKATTRRL